MTKRVTIEDVARASHVSVATVSLVMRGRTGINIETRKRVEQVARALGYQRRKARSEHHVQRISVLMRHHQASLNEMSPLYAGVLSGIEDVCRRRGIRNDLRHMMMNDQSMLTNPILFPQQYEYGGVIGVGVRVDEYLYKHVHEHSMPFVLVDVDGIEGHLVDAVSVRFQHAMDDMINYLVSMGHRMIALIDEPHPSLHWQQSLRASMANYGMAEPVVLVAHPTFMSVHEVVQQMMMDPQISAVICRNDELARMVIAQLHTLGRYVPQHISVVGCNDLSSSVDEVSTLTTVRVDASALGVLAVQTLLHRIEWPNSPLLQTTIQADLVIRQSTQPRALYT